MLGEVFSCGLANFRRKSNELNKNVTKQVLANCFEYDKFNFVNHLHEGESFWYREFFTKASE